jgi:tetratricopeptide (TPR) repeat protein
MADEDQVQNDGSFYHEDFDDAGPTETVADFYDHEVDRYSAALDEDLEDAMQRYGFTLFHSLPFTKQLELGRKLGFEPRDAVDFYNLAGVEIEAERYEAAIKLLQQALKADGQFADAAYNLALSHERLGNRGEAAKQWNRYLELTEDDASRQQVQAHLAEMNA